MSREYCGCGFVPAEDEHDCPLNEDAWREGWGRIDIPSGLAAKLVLHIHLPCGIAIPEEGAWDTTFMVQKPTTPPESCPLCDVRALVEGRRGWEGLLSRVIDWIKGVLG